MPLHIGLDGTSSAPLTEPTISHQRRKSGPKSWNGHGTEIRDRKEQHPTTNPVCLCRGPPRKPTQAVRALTSLGASGLSLTPRSRSQRDLGWDPSDRKPGPFNLNIWQEGLWVFVLLHPHPLFCVQHLDKLIKKSFCHLSKSHPHGSKTHTL